MIGYHVTSADDYRNHISKQGLVPKLGVRSFMIQEHERRIYFFPTMDALEDGIMNWLGDALEDSGVSEIAILKVDLSGIDVYKTFSDSGNSWEIFTIETVPPDKITLIRYESLIEESLRPHIRSLLKEEKDDDL